MCACECVRVNNMSLQRVATTSYLEMFDAHKATHSSADVQPLPLRPEPHQDPPDQLPDGPGALVLDHLPPDLCGRPARGQGPHDGPGPRADGLGNLGGERGPG